VAETLKQLAHTHAEDAFIACFSHCDAIRLALAYFLNMPINDFQRLTIDTTGVSALAFEGVEPVRVLYMNR
jgi:broad specificity phosphatase PhoE